MKPFENSSNEGNEKAIRRGRKVPDGDINLAYVKAPEFSPKENMVVVDTSRIAEENIISGSQRKLYYANSIGILMDQYDNMAVPDEFPVISDVFAGSEDINTRPASEYADEDILPFRHVSRYFHLDHAGLTMGSEQLAYEHEAIKVIDSQGLEYPKYKTKIVAAYLPGNETEGDVWAYRVFAYIDTDEIDNLYLTYNKVELTDDGELVRRQINHREILNPQSFFAYTPEESVVVDVDNRNEKIFSTKPVSLKDKALGKPKRDSDGYKIYVPKKAVGDPRVYQLFRWRIKCHFLQDVTVLPTQPASVIRCGVIVTDSDLAQSSPSRAPYALYNLERSNFNSKNVLFQNPAKPAHTDSEKSRRDYWFVNIDRDNLTNYDLLIWAPDNLDFNMAFYSAKIEDFVSRGGTLFLDTDTFADARDTLGGAVSAPVHPSTGDLRFADTDNEFTTPVRADHARWQNLDHALIAGKDQLEGWQLTASNNILQSTSYTQHVDKGRKYSQNFEEKPEDFITLIEAALSGTEDDSPPDYKPVTITKQVGRGHRIYSTFGHLFTCSALIHRQEGNIINNNWGVTRHSVSDYNQHVSSPLVEGGMKLLYNAALLAVEGRAINDENFSTRWSYTTPWRSSWVIDAREERLSQEEKEEHNFVIDARDVHADPPDTTPLWKRQLSSRTVKELVDEALDPILSNPATAGRADGPRRYVLEVTNPYVRVASKVIENDRPKVWTEVFSPHFVVPAELGPHVIREEEREAQFDEGVTYIHREYPEKPYGGRVSVTYTSTEQVATTVGTSYTASGTGIGRRRTITGGGGSPGTPDETKEVSRDLSLSWWDAQVATLPASSRGSPTSAGTRFSITNQAHRRGTLAPWGLISWQNSNYHTSSWGPGHLNFPFFVSWQRLLRGSSGDLVRFVQHALNRFRSVGYFSPSTGSLNVDGSYGALTERAVRDFQSAHNARWVDGVIDAETWSIIGWQVYRLRIDNKLPSIGSNFTQYYGHWNRMGLHRISNGSTSGNANIFGKRSWRTGGPEVVWDLYAIRFGGPNSPAGNNPAWNAITVVPWVAGGSGGANTMMVRSIHVTNWRSLSGYDSNSGQLRNMTHRPRDGQALKIPFGPYKGDTIILGVGQDKSSGHGSSRFFGLRDVRAHTTVTETETIPGTPGTPGSTIERISNHDFNFTVSGNVSVRTYETVTRQLQVPNSVLQQNNFISISNVKWNNITANHSGVQASINSNGRASFYTEISQTIHGSGQTQGNVFGVNAASSFVYYSIDENGRFNPVRETGFVSKADGIKLLCDAQKRPVGFPSMPTNVGNQRRSYVKMTVASSGSDASVQMGFYDRSRKEWLGSEITHGEYQQRGSSNVYVGLISDYERAEERLIPVDEDAPKLPYKWAMPVYGVSTRVGSRITLESLPDRLGPTDVWPIAVRQGRFTRTVKLRSRASGPLTGYLGDYQDSTVHAYYDLPEAELGGYSRIYGPPNADVVDEEPIILDDNILQVRQAPILNITRPTQYPNPADPMRPAIKLYKRPNRGAPWEEQPSTELRDYNLRTGELFLRTPLTSNDSSLLRVDYTTTRRHYHLKKHEDKILNLNLYSEYSRDLIGEAIYVYVVPHYVKDDMGYIIPASKQQRALRISLTPSVFDPMSVDYNPLAIQLGVVYLSTALDIDRLAILDTRKRGGGVATSTNTQEIVRLVSEAVSYWDMGHAAGGSYQKGGYLVVRLPEELKDTFSERELRDIIKRNITAGVGFKIEDLEGRDWSS